MALIAKVPNSFTLLFRVFLFFVTQAKIKGLFWLLQVFIRKTPKVGA